MRIFNEIIQVSEKIHAKKEFYFYRYLMGISFLMMLLNIAIILIFPLGFLSLSLFKLGLIVFFTTIIISFFPTDSLYKEIKLYGYDCSRSSIKILINEIDYNRENYKEFSRLFYESLTVDNYRHLYRDGKIDDKIICELKTNYFLYYYNNCFNHKQFPAFVSDDNLYSQNRIIYKTKLLIFSSIIIGWVVTIKIWDAEFWSDVHMFLLKISL